MNSQLPNQSSVQSGPRMDYQDKPLRFLTAGSVDDGKSTLIGRLLFDGKAVLADQMDMLRERAAGEPLDLSLLTDGLDAEREQGITIDVAFRYFTTPRRKFIIADSPGHLQYTRNMVTAAAGSDAAVIIVDVTKLNWDACGDPDEIDPSVDLLAQTRRHAILVHQLRIPRIIFAVNKLDAVAEDDAHDVYLRTHAAIQKFSSLAGIPVYAVVPISALRGDNVVFPSRAGVAGLDKWGDWYEGDSLLEILETLSCVEERDDFPFLMPVQGVQVGPHVIGKSSSVRRSIYGKLASGTVSVGDEMRVFPSGETAHISDVSVNGNSCTAAYAGQNASLKLDFPVDVSRGCWLMKRGHFIESDEVKATIFWMDNEPMKIGRKYTFRHGCEWVTGTVTAIEYKLDILTLKKRLAEELLCNDIGRVDVKLSSPIPNVPYSANRQAGSLIVVDPATNATSGLLLIAF